MRTVSLLRLYSLLLAVSACATGQVAVEEAANAPPLAIVFTSTDVLDGFNQWFGESLVNRFTTDGFNAAFASGPTPGNAPATFVLYLSRSPSPFGRFDVTARLAAPHTGETLGIWVIGTAYPEGIADRMINIQLGTGGLYRDMRRSGALVQIVAASYPEGSPEREKALKRARSLAAQAQ